MNKKVLNNKKPNINKSSDNNITSINNLNYTIDNNIINIKNFDTKEPYITNKFYLEDLTETRGIIHKNKEEYTNLLLKKKRLSMSLKL